MPSTPWGLSAGRTAAVGITALLIGAGVGAGIGQAGGTTRTAQVQLALQQDPQVLDSGGGTDLTTFLQTELVYLNSPALSEQVQTQLNLRDAPELAAARVDQSAVVQLTSTGATAAQAEQRVSAAAQSYIDRRTTTATQEVDEQLTSVQAQIADLQGQLASLAAATVVGESPTPQALALQSQLQNVLELQSTLALSRQQATRGAVVIQDATTLPTGTPGWVLGAATGGVLALLSALGVLVARARLSRRLRTPQQLGRLNTLVVAPSLNTSGHVLEALTAGGGAGIQRAARLQAAQIPALGDRPQSRAVVFVGASDRPEVGVAAAVHAIALARRGPTVLVCAQDVVHPGLAEQLGVPTTTRGLTDLAAEPSTAVHRVTGLLVQSSVPGLRVLAAGSDRDGLGGLERVVREGLIAELAGSGLRVVVDAPSLDLSSVAVDLAREAGSAVLVAPLGRSQVSDVSDTLDVLRSSGVPVEAVLLTTHGKAVRVPPTATPPVSTPGTVAGSVR